MYKAVLDMSYYFIISSIWAYAKFDLNLNILKLIESYFLLFTIFSLMPKFKEKLSNIIIWLLILLSYVPMLTLFAFMDQPRVYMYAITGFWLLVFLLLKFPSVSLSPFRKSQSKIIYYLIFISLFLLVLSMIYKYFGFFFNFDLTKVYEIRSYYKEMEIPLAGYLFNWLANVINPVFFAIFLIKRKWIWLGLVIFLQILLFSVTGMKAFLFILPFVLGLMWVVNRKNPFIWMSAGMCLIVLLGIMSFYLVDDIKIISLFTRRTLLVPAQLSFFYYDFFNQNPHTLLSQHHIFGSFSSYPYHLSPPNLIGEAYFNNPRTNANNGIYADAYMNFGFIGFLLWAFLFVIILKLVDSFSRNKKTTLTIAAIAKLPISFTNGALLTSFLTSGLLLMLILLYLLPKEEE